MTTADWLRYSANTLTEADATQEREKRRLKVMLAEGYERLAKHAAYLADDDTDSSVGRLKRQGALCIALEFLQKDTGP